jgi:hypothetical protein
MNHIVNIRVRIEHPLERLLIGDIELKELRPLPTDQLDAIDNLLGRVLQVVSDDDFVASFQQRERRE